MYRPFLPEDMYLYIYILCIYICNYCVYIYIVCIYYIYYIYIYYVYICIYVCSFWGGRWPVFGGRMVTRDRWRSGGRGYNSRTFPSHPRAKFRRGTLPRKQNICQPRANLRRTISRKQTFCEPARAFCEPAERRKEPFQGSSLL